MKITLSAVAFSAALALPAAAQIPEYLNLPDTASSDVKCQQNRLESDPPQRIVSCSGPYGKFTLQYEQGGWLARSPVRIVQEFPGITVISLRTRNGCYDTHEFRERPVIRPNTQGFGPLVFDTEVRAPYLQEEYACEWAIKST